MLFLRRRQEKQKKNRLKEAEVIDMGCRFGTELIPCASQPVAHPARERTQPNCTRIFTNIINKENIFIFHVRKNLVEPITEETDSGDLRTRRSEWTKQKKKDETDSHFDSIKFNQKRWYYYLLSPGIHLQIENEKIEKSEKTEWKFQSVETLTFKTIFIFIGNIMVSCGCFLPRTNTCIRKHS